MVGNIKKAILAVSLIVLYIGGFEAQAQWQSSYNEVIDRSVRQGTIHQNLLSCKPTDFNSDWCGGKSWESLNSNEKVSFYRELLFKLAEFESSYNPNTTYRENFSDSSGRNVISTGLLQISTESSKAYGCNHTDLKSPESNLRCGTKILAKQVCSSGKIAGKGSGSGCYGGYCGAASYWSPFRNASKLAKIKKHVQENAEGCGGSPGNNSALNSAGDTSGNNGNSVGQAADTPFEQIPERQSDGVVGSRAPFDLLPLMMMPYLMDSRGGAVPSVQPTYSRDPAGQRINPGAN